MGKFIFNYDQLVSVWKRESYEVEANSMEEAIEKVKSVNLKEDDLESIGSFMGGSEYLFETETDLTPGEIIGGSTTEIGVDRTGKVIYSNAD